MRPPRVLVVFLLATSLLLVAPSVAAAQPVARPSADQPATVGAPNGTETPNGTAATGVTNVTYGGEGVVQRHDGNVYLWRSAPYSVNVTYQLANNDAFVYSDVCVIYHANNGTDAKTCRHNGADRGTFSATFSGRSWPVSDPANAAATVLVNRSNASETVTVASEKLSVHPLVKSGDYDGDDLSNQAEIARGTWVDDSDYDDDGLDDGAEVHEYHTDPLHADSDGDGLRDPRELSIGTSPTDPDSDGDGLDDGREVRKLSTSPTDPDSNDNGIADGRELAAGANPAVNHTDSDGLSDALEIRLGTDPASAWSPFGWGLLAVAVVAVALAGWRPGVLRGILARLQSDDEGEGSGGETADDDRPLTDTEHVRELLSEHGGQLRQSRIVEETGWSKAKVSRVLSRMNDDGDISKIRIGRENLVCLAGEEPEGATTNFDD